MKAALKKGVADGTLVQVKASYKLSPEAKKASNPKKPAAKKAPVKKDAPKKKVRQSLMPRRVHDASSHSLVVRMR